MKDMDYFQNIWVFDSALISLVDGKIKKNMLKGNRIIFEKLDWLKE